MLVIYLIVYNVQFPKDNLFVQNLDRLHKKDIRIDQQEPTGNESKSIHFFKRAINL